MQIEKELTGEGLTWRWRGNEERRDDESVTIRGEDMSNSEAKRRKRIP